GSGSRGMLPIHSIRSEMRPRLPGWTSASSHPSGGNALISPPHRARPAEEPHSTFLHLIETELAQIDDLENAPDLCPNFFFGNERRPGIMGLASVAGQDQASTAGASDLLESSQITAHVDPPDDVITAAVEDEIVRPADCCRRIEHVSFQESNGDPSIRCPIPCSVQRQRAEVDCCHVKALLC